jgi:hypothetical protein
MPTFQRNIRHQEQTNYFLLKNIPVPGCSMGEKRVVLSLSNSRGSGKGRYFPSSQSNFPSCEKNYRTIRKISYVNFSQIPFSSWKGRWIPGKIRSPSLVHFQPTTINQGAIYEDCFLFTFVHLFPFACIDFVNFNYSLWDQWKSSIQRVCQLSLFLNLRNSKPNIESLCSSETSEATPTTARYHNVVYYNIN